MEHGWDENHYVYHCTDGDHPSFWKTVIESPQWKEWYEENGRRFSEGTRSYTEEKGWVGKPAFDIDESMECGQISPEHFQEFLKYTIERSKDKTIN